MGKIRATHVAHVREALDVPGAIELREIDGIVEGFAFVCPCGCGQQSWLPVRIAGEPVDHPSWEWDGNREAPTLRPSILNSGMHCRWYGYLTAGVFEPC